MLNFMYYPVSAVLGFWHDAFSSLLGPSSGLGWWLAVVFLAFTRNVLLFKPTVNLARTRRKYEKLAPQVQQLKTIYADDPQTMVSRTQQLHAQHGINSLAGCLQTLFMMIVAISGFFGLLQVLKSFNRPFLSVEQNSQTANYAFSALDVQYFLDARLFGVPLSASVTDSAELLARYGDLSRWGIAAVVVPLTIAASALSHRASKERSIRMWPMTPTPSVGATVYLYPLIVIVLGPFLPLGVVLYWLTNNFWTLNQDRVLARRIDAEDAGYRVLPNPSRRRSYPRQRPSGDPRGPGIPE